MEELVAELGSAFLSADLDLTPELREDHAAYIDNWLTVLKQDKRAISTRAVRLLLSRARSRRGDVERRTDRNADFYPADLQRCSPSDPIIIVLW